MKWTGSRKDVIKNSLAIFVVILVSVIGVKLLMSSHALSGAVLSVSPASATVTPGQNVTFAIKEDSGTDLVNSVQASLNYDASQLQYVSMTEGTAFPTTAATSTSTPGVIRVARATYTPVNGSNTIVSLTFKVLASSGTINLSFDRQSSLIMRSTDSTDILGSTVGASYTVNGGGGPSASMLLSPGSGTATSGSNVTVTIRENSGTSLVNAVQSSVGYDAAALQFVSLSEGGTFTNVAATDTSTPGRIRVGRSVQSGSAGVQGDNPIVTITFKVLASSGTTALTIDKAQSFVVASSNNADILQTVAGSSITVSPVSPPGGATLSLNPGSGNFAPGSNISVLVKANGGAAALTTIEAALNYPASQLQFVSVAEGTVFTTAQRTNTSTAGFIDIIRSIPGGNAGVSGTNNVVTLTFKVIGSGGSAAISYASSSAIFDNSGTGTNILDLANSTAASYTISSTPPACSSNPSQPGMPVRSGLDYTTITFNWAASTPGSSCTLAGYHIFSDGSLIGDVTSGTSFTDSGLVAGQQHTYWVQAFDTAGHSSTTSPAATLSSKPDDMSPTTPVGVTAAAPNSATVNLTWTPSTDFPNPGGVGVGGYYIYRNGSSTPTYTVTSGMSFVDSNVQPNTTYSYTVSSFDALGNESSPSNIVSAKTPPSNPACTGSPSTPAGLKLTSSTGTTADISWNTSSPAAGCVLAGYRVYRDSQLVGSVTAPLFHDSGLSANIKYIYTVMAYDTSGHSSALSPALTVSTGTDTVRPTDPTSVMATAISAGRVDLSWNASTDNVAVAGYIIRRLGTIIMQVPATARSYSDTTVTGNSDYTYRVSAVDAAGNESLHVIAVPNPVHTPSSNDTQPPTVPTKLRLIASSTTSIVLAWNASTDNVAVAGYHVFRDGKLVGDASGLTFTDLSLSPNTSYVYTVKAFDAGGNTSAASAALNARTQGLANCIIGDINCDKIVDEIDLSILLSHLGETATPPLRFGNINGDMSVDEIDLSILLSHLGEKA